MRIDEYIVPENVIPIIRNEQVLEELPENIFYVRKEDLVVLFRIEMPTSAKEQEDLMLITEETVKLWEMNTQEVYAIALKNMREKNDLKIYTLESIGKQIFLGAEREEFSKEVWEQMEIPVVVLGKADCKEGAVGILDTDKLQEISEIVKEDLYILPSSIHECLLVPKSKMNLQEAQKMVGEINILEVAPEDRLSDNIYEYSAATKEIVMAGNELRKKESVEHIR